jgi:hypothetical protein
MGWTAPPPQKKKKSALYLKFLCQIAGPEGPGPLPDAEHGHRVVCIRGIQACYQQLQHRRCFNATSLRHACLRAPRSGRIRRRTTLFKQRAQRRGWWRPGGKRGGQALGGFHRHSSAAAARLGVVAQ